MILLFLDSIPNRDRGVVVSQIVVHRQGNPSGVLAAIPAEFIVVAAEGGTVHSAKVAVNSVVASTIVVGAVIDELCVDQSVVAVVTEHHVFPEEVEQRHVTQVDDVVGIAVNLKAVVVEVVKRSIIERSEGDAQDAVDDRGSSVGVPSSRNQGAIPYKGSGTIGTCGRGQGATPTPQVVGVVVVEVVVIVVAGVVKVVVVAETLMSTMSVTTVASVSVTTVASIGLVVRLASVGLVARLAAIVVTGLAAVSVRLADSGHSGTRGEVGSLVWAVDVHSGVVALANHSSCSTAVAAAAAVASRASHSTVAGA